MLTKAVVIMRIDGAMVRTVNAAINCNVEATSCGLLAVPTSILTLGIRGAAEASPENTRNKSRKPPKRKLFCQKLNKALHRY